MKSVIDELKKIAAEFPIPVIIPHQPNFNRPPERLRGTSADIIIIDYIDTMPSLRPRRPDISDIFV